MRVHLRGRRDSLLVTVDEWVRSVQFGGFPAGRSSSVQIGRTFEKVIEQSALRLGARFEHGDIGHHGPHTGEMSMGCSTVGWSAVTSASANAVLAAVLAGFMINGMVLVLGRKPERMMAEVVRAVSLMFAAFVALGLDAYLFGFVTGDSNNVSACRR